MANASAKRTAQQNAETIKNMNLGMLLTGALSLLLRILFRKGTLSPTRISFWLLVLSYVPSIFLSRYLERIGSPKRDPTTGTLISSGEDLGRPGVIEYASMSSTSPVRLHVTHPLAQPMFCFCLGVCQIGSGIFGEWFWFLYLIIPVYAGYKLWTLVISPLLLGRSTSANDQEDTAPKEASSKRQEKLRKRAERAHQSEPEADVMFTSGTGGTNGHDTAYMHPLQQGGSLSHPEQSSIADTPIPLPEDMAKREPVGTTLPKDGPILPILTRFPTVNPRSSLGDRFSSINLANASLQYFKDRAQSACETYLPSPLRSVITTSASAAADPSTSNVSDSQIEVSDSVSSTASGSAIVVREELTKTVDATINASPPCTSEDVATSAHAAA
ncbi:uncharacterized protein B0H18DRAFT_1205689 [Fomitopsis serialis]|uniref:uncharacterized protein n=1 Tax=Fomitopsis serialis TaxID=139415 RepID=UPI0020078FF6|nr:uncharacterized protein B0H18DRAFT_1205689 [Neoantrodia serialis]KAH9938454.1 hypothetical protein B0H18DRAFT_1205689 [Neoantrodia serialis]